MYLSIFQHTAWGLGMEHGTLRRSIWVSQPWCQWWLYVSGTPRMLAARRDARSTCQCETPECPLQSEASTEAREQRYQHLPPLRRVHTVTTRSYPLYLHWCHSHCSVCPWHLHDVCIWCVCLQSSDQGQGEAVGEPYNQAPLCYTVSCWHWDPLWWKRHCHVWWSAGLPHHVSETIPHARCSSSLTSHGPQSEIWLTWYWGGEGKLQGQHGALSSNGQIFDVHTSCDATRDIICSRCSLPIQ